MNKDNKNDCLTKCASNCLISKICQACQNENLKVCDSKCGKQKLCVNCGEIVLMTCDELHKKNMRKKYQHTKLPFPKKCACPGTRRFYFLSEVYQPCTPWSTYEDCDCGL